MPNDKQVKLLIKYYSPVLDQLTVETLWADVIDEVKGLYKIDNIPFYGPLLACEDIVFAEYDDSEGMLTYRKTVEHSGNSVILIVMMDEITDVEIIRDEFRKMGCESEGTGKRYFTMEVPFGLSYEPIRNLLLNYKRKGVLEYSEPCLSKKHSY